MTMLAGRPSGGARRPRDAGSRLPATPFIITIPSRMRRNRNDRDLPLPRPVAPKESIGAWRPVLHVRLEHLLLLVVRVRDRVIRVRLQPRVFRVLQEQADARAFIGIRKVCEIAGFSKATILRRIKAGTFPRPVIAQGNCVRFDLSEILAWRAEQFRKREERQAVASSAAKA